MGWTVLAVTCSLGCSDDWILAPSLEAELGVSWLGLREDQRCSMALRWRCQHLVFTTPMTRGRWKARGSLPVSKWSTIRATFRAGRSSNSTLESMPCWKRCAPALHEILHEPLHQIDPAITLRLKSNKKLGYSSASKRSKRKSTMERNDLASAVAS